VASSFPMVNSFAFRAASLQGFGLGIENLAWRWALS
jgi:hypothetical protein